MPDAGTAARPGCGAASGQAGVSRAIRPSHREPCVMGNRTGQR
ncbi:hypothetical protein Ga0080574_TMP1130 [Salipiger abyssi]|uniref:Uncharacterized protein n=1 Tax=Salipiger abyssi TaxID=1250539 RepID=A0A1P8UPY3_9RHOB|nr:hypothetical protein Ga0080574_TMP1130 [Salipiger abyssi]